MFIAGGCQEGVQAQQNNDQVGEQIWLASIFEPELYHAMKRSLLNFDPDKDKWTTCYSSDAE